MTTPTAQEAGELSDLRNWGALVFPVLDQAAKVIQTIEPESWTEGDELKALTDALADLARQYAVITRPTRWPQEDE